MTLLVYFSFSVGFRFLKYSPNSSTFWLKVRWNSLHIPKWEFAYLQNYFVQRFYPLTYKWLFFQKHFLTGKFTLRVLLSSPTHCEDMSGCRWFPFAIIAILNEWYNLRVKPFYALTHISISSTTFIREWGGAKLPYHLTREINILLTWNLIQRFVKMITHKRMFNPTIATILLTSVNFHGNDRFTWKSLFS